MKELEYEKLSSYSIDEGQTWINTAMNNISNNTYMGKTPGFEAGTHVQYKIIAYDNANNPAVEDRNGEYYIYPVTPEFTTTAFLLILVSSKTVIFIAKKIAKTRDKIKTFQYAHNSIKPINIITSFVVQ